MICSYVPPFCTVLHCSDRSINSPLSDVILINFQVFQPPPTLNICYGLTPFLHFPNSLFGPSPSNRQKYFIMSPILAFLTHFLALIHFVNIRFQDDPVANHILSLDFFGGMNQNWLLVDSEAR